MVISKPIFILSPMPIPFRWIVVGGLQQVGISLATIKDLETATVHHHSRHIRLRRWIGNRRFAAIHQRQGKKSLNGLVTLVDTLLPDFLGDTFDLLGGDM